MKKNILKGFLLLGLIIVVTVIFTSIRQTKQQEDFLAWGNVEIVHAALGFQVSGILKERYVQEGQKVQKGELLAVLDSDDAQVSLLQAEAQSAYAQAVLDELQSGSRPEEIQEAQYRKAAAAKNLESLKNGSRKQEIEEAKALVSSLEATVKANRASLDQAQADADRYENLLKRNSISLQANEHAQTALKTAQARHAEAQAQLKRAQQSLSLAEEGVRREKIEEARANYQQSEARLSLVEKGPREEQIRQATAKLQLSLHQVESARLFLEHTQLKAPFDGTILSKSAESGEYLQPGKPVVNLGDLLHAEVRVWVPENRLSSIRTGQTAEILYDGESKAFLKGTVGFISPNAEFTPKTVQTEEERIKLVYQVRIDVLNPDEVLKAGMPVTVRFER